MLYAVEQPAKKAKGVAKPRARKPTSSCDEDVPLEGARGGAKRARAAAAAVTGRYAEVAPGGGKPPRGSRDDYVQPKAEVPPISEADALAATRGMVGQRRVFDFTGAWAAWPPHASTSNSHALPGAAPTVTDADGLQQPLLTASTGLPPPFQLFLSGFVLAEEGPVPSGKGGLTSRIADVPLTQVLLGAHGAAADVVFVTAAAKYGATKPAAGYRAIFEGAAQAGVHAREVLQALSLGEAPQPSMELREMAARLARLHGCSLAVAKGYLVRDAPHILARLKAEDVTSDPGGKGKGKATRVALSQLPFTTQLQAEVAAAAREALRPLNPVAAGSGIVIRNADDVAPAAVGPGAGVTITSEAQMSADAALARALAEADHSKGVKRAQKAVQRAAAAAAGREAYIKIDESEFKDDYPAPVEYVKEEEELDELLMDDLDGDAPVVINPDDLPRRLLYDFAIYKDDGMCATLELIPMWAGVDPDVELFASGVVAEDLGDFATGGVSAGQAEPAPVLPVVHAAPAHAMEEGPSSAAGGSSGPGPSSAAGAAGGSSSAAAAAAAAPAPGPVAATPSGPRLYLSAIKEWVVEFGADMVFLSLRTDSAWYRLVTPSGQYSPWWAPLVKASRVAVRALQLVAEEERAARLTLDGLVKKLAETPAESPAFVSAKPQEVERYLTAHGQILLNQFRNFPAAAVQKSPIPAALRDRMALRRHTALSMGGRKKAGAIRRTGQNLNPIRSVAARSKPMRATTTSLVHRIWTSTVAAAEEEACTCEPAAGGLDDEAAVGAKDTGAGEDEGDADDEAGPSGAAPRRATRQAQPSGAAKRRGRPGVQASRCGWGDTGVAAADGTTVHGVLTVDGVAIRHGDPVWVVEESEDGGEVAGSGSETPRRVAGLVMKLWQEADGDAWVMARMFVTGTETVLRTAAADRELFLSPTVLTVPIALASPGPVVRRVIRPWGFDHRAAAEAEDAAERAAAEERAKAGLPVQFFYRTMYVPDQGAFLDIPPGVLDAEAYIAEQAAADEAALPRLVDKRLLLDGASYSVGDYMYLLPDAFKELQRLEAVKKHEAATYLREGQTHKGASQHLRAFAVGRLLSVNAAGKEPESVTLRRMVRPEELGPTHGYEASRWALYDSDIQVTVKDLGSIVGPCTVLPPGHVEGPDTFVVCGTWDAQRRCVGPPPKDMGVPPSYAAAASQATQPPAASSSASTDALRLKTLDIFAGCGGLSEGMRQAGAARSLWAIEYEPDAADAFRVNHPGTHVFTANCNVILRRCMAKAGLPPAEALASPEAEEQAAAMAPGEVAALPLPGQVDFICGGPPCQGFSGMNRFTQKGSLWSKVQNEMILSFLSYADLYRPRFFLLENVRNFVAFNKGLTFRTAVRTLLDIGYQVRFGVLNAAFYGVGQSRKRAFLLAAAPGEHMPSWPLPVTCFNSPQLTFELPCGTRFCAVPQRKSAPLRAVTVRDMIGDLPPVPNGAEDDDLGFTRPPASAFQKDIRNGAPRLRNHVCKVLNEVNVKRCSLIPKESNHDWRYLRVLVDSGQVEPLYQTASMAKAQPIVPLCLPQTEARHNGWRGLYSRLDWEGHFPTSTTDPNPMGKVGQVFHPCQDRIVSVRECARSQGFPDTFVFVGPVSSKHRQVGNAVPPPLAAALGRELRKALEQTAKAKQ